MTGVTRAVQSRVGRSGRGFSSPDETPMLNSALSSGPGCLEKVDKPWLGLQNTPRSLPC